MPPPPTAKPFRSTQFRLIRAQNSALTLLKSSINPLESCFIRQAPEPYFRDEFAVDSPLQEGVRCEPDLLDHGYIPDVLGGIEPSLVMPPELVIPPELVAEVTYLTWAAASVLRMVY
jgi:hypothetical protein